MYALCRYIRCRFTPAIIKAALRLRLPDDDAAADASLLATLLRLLMPALTLFTPMPRRHAAAMPAATAASARCCRSR